jgi:hypothetical protein
MLQLQARGPGLVRIRFGVSVPVMLQVIAARAAPACAGG